jgi:hypothetical protein
MENIEIFEDKLLMNFTKVDLTEPWSMLSLEFYDNIDDTLFSDMNKVVIIKPHRNTNINKTYNWSKK